jgi:hypothetical protein
MLCPYNRFALYKTSVEIENKFTEENLKKFDEIVQKRNFSVDKNTLDQRVANGVGITVEDLKQSLNYNRIVNEYMSRIAFNIVEDIKSEIGFSDKEAWATMLLALDGEAAFKNVLLIRGKYMGSLIPMVP